MSGEGEGNMSEPYLPALVADVTKSGLPVGQGMLRLLSRGEELYPDQPWSGFREIAYDAEAELVLEWLSNHLASDPMPDEYIGVWIEPMVLSSGGLLTVQGLMDAGEWERGLPEFDFGGDRRRPTEALPG